MRKGPGGGGKNWYGKQPRASLSRNCDVHLLPSQACMLEKSPVQGFFFFLTYSSLRSGLFGVGAKMKSHPHPQGAAVSNEGLEAVPLQCPGREGIMNGVCTQRLAEGL